MNKGSSGARNIALKEAKGQYIAFLDSDDMWPEEYLESQVNFLQNGESYYSLCFSTTYRRTF